MEKDKIVQLIEQELVQADEAKNDAEFEKHIYAIHTLTSLVTSSNSKQHYRDNTYSLSSSFQSARNVTQHASCLLYTSDAADDLIGVVGGGGGVI